MTHEKAIQLHEQLKMQINVFEKNADVCAICLSALENKPKSEINMTYKSILNTQLMLCFINLDLCAAYRQYLSIDASTNYEKRQAMTKINIVISEGYKKLYGYNGQQNNSFWVVHIKRAVDFLDSYQEEYKNIEKKLKCMQKDKVVNKDMRDLAVHYDTNPMKVYDMLSKLNAEEVTERCVKFLKLLMDIIEFVWKLIKQIQTKLPDEYMLSTKMKQ